ncbi:hypothetical protein C0995_013414, partial [Termitomyces sp. Mi166
LLLQEQEEFWRLVVDTGTFFLMAMEDDDDNEEATQKLRKELEDFVVPTTFDDKLLASLLPPPSEYFEGDSGLPRGAKISGCLWNGISIRTQKKRPPFGRTCHGQGYKEKGKAKALLEDSEQTGAKQSFKLRELVDSDSDKEDEKDRVCVIKKIKRKHVEELTSTKKRKEIIELDEEVEIVASKTPVAGPSCPT